MNKLPPQHCITEKARSDDDRHIGYNFESSFESGHCEGLSILYLFPKAYAPPLKKVKDSLSADLVDLRAVFLVHDAAFDLEGRGHFAFVDGEFAWEEGDALYTLVVRKFGR